MLIMEHLFTYAFECVVATILKLEISSFKFMVVIQKQLPLGSHCLMVSLLNNLALFLALKLLEISLSLFLGFHLFNLLQFITINQGAGGMPPSQFVSNYMDPLNTAN